LVQKRCQRGPRLKVAAVSGQILSNQVELPYSAVRQRARLGDQIERRAALMGTADRRDDAERALVIASFGDLQVRGKNFPATGPRRFQSGQQMSRAWIGDWPRIVRLGAAQQVRKVEEIPGADEDVDFRELFTQLGAIALRQASGDHQAPAGPLPLDFRRLENRVERFLLGGFNKGAGVDHQDIGLGWIEGQRVSGLAERAKHELAVNRVLGAAERQEVDPFHSAIFRGHISLLVGNKRCNRGHLTPAQRGLGAVTTSVPSGTLKLKRLSSTG
jgi:hypothetical protein